MLQHLVVKSQFAQMGRGVNGRTIYTFLRTYFGRRNVRICALAEVRAERQIIADTIFLGLPTTSTVADLEALRCRRLILFDLLDTDRLMWDDQNRQFLADCALMYLKGWVDKRWSYGIPMGMAPVRRYRRLAVSLNWQARWPWRSRRRQQRKYDVAFVGSPTRPEIYKNGVPQPYHQRVEWLLEVKRQAPHYQFVGGLLRMSRRFGEVWDMDIHQEIKQAYGDVDDLMLDRKIGFHRYFSILHNSKVLLAPKGFAPWSYRHYEAIYAGATVVTTDFRPLDTLVPLPVHNMVHVEDHEPVLPAIELALRMHAEKPHLIDDNIAFLERYLSKGVYSKKRPRLLDRFMAQLPDRNWKKTPLI